MPRRLARSSELPIPRCTERNARDGADMSAFPRRHPPRLNKSNVDRQPPLSGDVTLNERASRLRLTLLQRRTSFSSGSRAPAKRFSFECPNAFQLTDKLISYTVDLCSLRNTTKSRLKILLWR